MTQEPLIPAPARTWPGGIFSRLLDSNRCVDPAAWRHHLDTRQHVGRCKTTGCGQPLVPGEPDETNPHRIAYPAECTGPERHEAIAYGPRPKKRPQKGAA